MIKSYSIKIKLDDIIYDKNYEYRVLENVFTEEGNYITEKIFSLPSKKACKFCEFNGTEHCSDGVK